MNAAIVEVGGRDRRRHGAFRIDIDVGFRRSET
jgi:hypothetical protein